MIYHFDAAVAADADGQILNLSEKSVKVMDLTSRNEEHIVCASISPCGTWLAYSTCHNFRLFRLNTQLVSLATTCIVKFDKLCILC